MSNHQENEVRAALILIGNELLSGKLKDKNGEYTIKRMRELGITLTEIRVIPDNVSSISAAIIDLSQKNTFVITSGGIGPTHDDLTLDALSSAFNAPRKMCDHLAKRIRARFKDDPIRQEVWVSMARIPQGCELITYRQNSWPVFKLNNVYSLPGVPMLYKRQFETCIPGYACRTIIMVTIYLQTDEGAITDLLRETNKQFSSVQIGSYPFSIDGKKNSRITLEARKRNLVKQACEFFTNQIEKTLIKEIRWDDPLLREEL